MTAGIGYPGVYATPNAVGAAAVFPTGHMYGCQLVWLSTSQVQITPGVCRSDDDTEDMVVTSTLTADITTTGANGRNVDTAEAASCWYAVFVIKNPTTGTVASFLVNFNDLGSFTFPAGYTVKRRIGWIRNNASSNFLNGFQNGFGQYRKWLYEEERSNLLALNGGSATTFTSVDLSTWVPPYQYHVLLNLLFDANTNSTAYVRPYNSSLTTPVTYAYEEANFQQEVYFEMRTDMVVSSPYIEYKVGNALDTLDIYVQGYIDILYP